LVLANPVDVVVPERLLGYESNPVQLEFTEDFLAEPKEPLRSSDNPYTGNS
jgi:hypothetical protein